MLEARMVCVQMFKRGAHDPEVVKLEAFHTDDPTDPNKAWSDATPSGALEMTISNPEAHGFFKPGATYAVRFEEVEVEATAD